MLSRLVSVGMKHGHLTVLREAVRTKRSIRLFECLCECGKVVVLRGSHFYESRRFCSQQCCFLAALRSVQVIGKKFDRWRVLEHAGKNKHGMLLYRCICDCGSERIISGNSLLNEASRSCGCLLTEMRSTGRTPEEELAIRRERSRLSNRKNPARVKANKIKYETKREHATPRWLTEEDMAVMNAMYESARELTRTTGVKHQVDHILPINGEFVSGLHVPLNLQILTQAENVSKSNRYAELSGD